MGKRKFLIDTDAGIDDAQAILMVLAHSHEVDIVGITVTHGNAECDQVSLNVLRVLQVADRMDIPVYKGVKMPIMGTMTDSSHHHGLDGFGDVPDPNAPGSEHIQKEHAVHAIIQLAKQYKGDLEMLCLGPLTNLAVSMRIDPYIGQKLKHCFIMGGNYEGKGNETASAEFNFFCDAEAAHIVLTELGCGITMVCWELCLKYLFSWDWYHKNVFSVPTKKARFMKMIESKMISTFYEGQGKAAYETADQLIAAIALNSELCTEMVDVFAEVELQGRRTRGQLVIEWKDESKRKRNVNIVISIDFELYKKMILGSIQD